MTSPQESASSPNAATRPWNPAEDPSSLARLLDDYLVELQAGRQPDRAQLVAAHPELASELDACLAGLDFIHRTAQTAGPPQRLGDFRITREIGRGGMGVVYEAEQISLRRRVALKVLRVAAGTDTEAINRFQREAETVAGLHHTNIVPIFAVGSEGGVHYYAMQLIDGRSLADVMRDAPPPPLTAARWCLEAAEALAHAHRRGVIHRDVKPSNLLIDGDGRIWLTDFGLARRASEATLTVTGALMGTPRYMSPEQASAAKLPIDHRTDVYSLGATLYELASGRPVFDAETPHAILTKIMSSEPVAPRRFNPGLPRDLETAILKCLAKEPRERYQSAQELADDLRRFVSGDPIRARRPSLLERARRWIRRRRQSVALSTAAAAVAAVLAVVAVVSWNGYREGQKGRLAFGTTGPHFKAELLDANDQPTGVSFTVPNEEAVRVEPGDYNVQLTRDGVLSETVQMSIEPAALQTFQLDLSARDLWDQTAIPRSDVKNDGFAFVDSGHRVDLLLTGTQRGLRMIRPKSDRTPSIDSTLWEVSWHGWFPWIGEESPGAEGFGYTTEMLTILNQRRRLAVPAPQLTKKDRFADPVWAGVSGLLAVNGQTGKVLWHHPWSTVPPAAAATPPAKPAESAFATKTGRPEPFDVNGDGTLDLIVAVEAPHKETKTGDDGKPVNTSTSHRWVEAVNGLDGKELWRRSFRGGWAPEIIQADDLPIEFVAAAGGKVLVCLDGPQILFVDPKSGADLRPPFDAGDEAPTQLRFFDLDGDERPDALVWRFEKSLHAVALSDGKEYPAFPKRFDFQPAGEITILPGSSPSLLVLKENAKAQLEVVRYEWSGETPVWSRPIRAVRTSGPAKHVWDTLPYRKPTWPVVADRWHNDPHRDVIVPDRFSRTKPEPDETPGTISLDFDDKSQWWAGLSVLDADTGEVRWQRQFPAQSDGGDYLQLDHFAAGDDVDGDGFREVYVAAFGSSYREAEGYGNYTHRYLYVTCLAGKDGRTLWWWRQRFFDDSSAFIEPLQWWQAGPDGHPLLMVSCNADSSHTSPKSPSATYFLQASTGKAEHVLTGVGEPKLADLSGDGILDLYSLVAPELKSSQFQSDVSPQLFTMKGTAPVAWSRLGRWEPTTDINGDGVADVLLSASTATKRVDAADGRTGRRLWQSSGVNVGWGGWKTQPLPEGDLDGDGVPDQISSSPMSRGALSLKTGRALWELGPEANGDADLRGDAVGMSYGGRVLMGPVLLRPFGGDRTIVVYEYRLKFGPTNVKEVDQQTDQLWIAAIEGRDGKVLWRTPLGEPTKGKYELIRTGLPADLDGDGRQDLVILCAGEPHWNVRGIRGADGEVLWTRELSQATGPFSTLLDEPPVLLVDNREDGGPRILVVERDCPVTSTENKGDTESVTFGTSAHQILSLDPKDGSPRRLWRGPETPPLTRTQDLVPWSARALLARFDAAGKSLCVNLIRPRPNAENDHYAVNDRVVLGPDDAVRSAQSFDVTVPWSSTLVMTTMIAADLDGDGFDELVWGARLSGGDVVFASRGGFDREKPIWKIDERSDGDMEFLPRLGGRDPLVVLHGDQMRQYAVSGLTGEVFWKAWPGSLLPTTSPDEPLRFLSRVEDLTTCHVAGQSVPPSRQAEAAARFDPKPDPRLAMPLPWAGWTEVIGYLQSSLYSLGLIVVPLVLLARTVARRSWRYGVVLAVWIGAIWYAYHREWLPGSLHSFEDLFAFLSAAQLLEKPLTPLTWIGFKLDLAKMRAILGLPVLGVGIAAVFLVRRWRWKGVAALVALTAVAAAITAAVLLKTSTSQFDEHQYYVGTDLVQIVLFGSYFLGLAALVIWVIARMGQFLWSLGGRIRRLTKRRPGAPEAAAVSP